MRTIRKKLILTFVSGLAAAFLSLAAPFIFFRIILSGLTFMSNSSPSLIEVLILLMIPVVVVSGGAMVLRNFYETWRLPVMVSISTYGVAVVVFTLYLFGVLADSFNPFVFVRGWSLTVLLAAFCAIFWATIQTGRPRIFYPAALVLAVVVMAIPDQYLFFAVLVGGAGWIVLPLIGLYRRRTT